MRVRTLIALLFASGLMLAPTNIDAQPIAVRQPEGVVHGFLYCANWTGPSSPPVI